MNLPSPGRRTLAAAAALAVTAATAWTLTSDPDPAPVPPSQVAAPAWERTLAGDVALTADTYRQLAAVHPGLDAESAESAGTLAAAVARADLTGRDRDRWPSYWPPAATTTTSPTVRCSTLDVLGTSSTHFDVLDDDRTWAKTLVAYAGTCGTGTYTIASPGVEYVYLRRDTTEAAWTPVREWNIAQVDDTNPDAGQPADWQLTDLGPCGVADDTRLRLRTMAADAFAQMCRAAADGDVVLVVDSAYRTRAQQARLFDEAVDHYGSVDKAREWVAYADENVCESKACTGTSVTVEPDNAALTWLHQPVACVAGTATRPLPAGQQCTTGEATVKRMQGYGFVAPLPRLPGYLEFVLPLGDDTTTAADCSPTGLGPDKVIAAVFRCRLARAGVPAAEVEQVTAEALVVAKCTSGWNPAMRALDGVYATEPSPADGRIYSEAGLFGLRADLTETGWLTGPATDPVANTHAAASLWLATRGWEQFGCATGTDPGLAAGPVLPQYGGPQLPAWATQY